MKIAQTIVTNINPSTNHPIMPTNPIGSTTNMSTSAVPTNQPGQGLIGQSPLMRRQLGYHHVGVANLLAFVDLELVEHSPVLGVGPQDGVPLAAAGLPHQGVHGLAAVLLAGPRAAHHLRDVADPEHLVHGLELACALRGEVGGQHAALVALFALVLARRARWLGPGGCGGSLHPN